MPEINQNWKSLTVRVIEDAANSDGTQISQKIKLLERNLWIDYNNSQTIKQLGLLYAIQLQYKKMEKVFEIYLKKSKNCVQILIYYLKSLICQSKYKKALSVCKRKSSIIQQCSEKFSIKIKYFKILLKIQQKLTVPEKQQIQTLVIIITLKHHKKCKKDKVKLAFLYIKKSLYLSAENLALEIIKQYSADVIGYQILAIKNILCNCQPPAIQHLRNCSYFSPHCIVYKACFIYHSLNIQKQNLWKQILYCLDQIVYKQKEENQHCETCKFIFPNLIILHKIMTYFEYFLQKNITKNYNARILLNLNIFLKGENIKQTQKQLITIYRNMLEDQLQEQ